MSAYRRDFDETRHACLMTNDELLEKYNAIWEKVRNNIKNNLIVNLDI